MITTPTPVFKLQIVYPDGTPLTFAAGSQFERTLVDTCCAAVMGSVRDRLREARQRVLAKKIGFFVSESRVERIVRDELDTFEAEIRQHVAGAVEEALLNLKRETLPLVEAALSSEAKADAKKRKAAE